MSSDIRATPEHLFIRTGCGDGRRLSNFRKAIDGAASFEENQLMSLKEPASKTGKTTIRLLSRAAAEREDRVSWQARTPAERLAAAEQLRQAVYGYDPATARIPAVIGLAHLRRGTRAARRKALARP
jgi:hypothetical protein